MTGSLLHFYGLAELHLWLFSLLHLWSNFIAVMVGGFITFVFKSYYIYDHFLLHLWLVLHLWVIQHHFRVYSDSVCSTGRSDIKVDFMILLLYQPIFCQCLEVNVKHCHKKSPVEKKPGSESGTCSKGIISPL